MRRFKLFAFVIIGLLFACDNNEDDFRNKPIICPCFLAPGIIHLESVSESILSEYPDFGIYYLYLWGYDSSLNELSGEERVEKLKELDNKYENMYFAYWDGSLSIYFAVGMDREDIITELDVISKELRLTQKEESKTLVQFIVPEGEEEEWITVFEEHSSVINAFQLCH